MLRFRVLVQVVNYAGIFLVIAIGFWNIQTPRAQASVIGSTSSSTLHPIEIDIPSIKAKIPIINVAVTSTNNLAVPHNFVQAGWYDAGPVPGAIGTAVIDGHVDNGGKKPSISGVFKNLNEVTLGSTISVTLSNGQVNKFKVTAISLYPYNQFPSAVVFAQTNKTLVNIITCDGTWVPYLNTYNKRLVVTAELI